MTPTHVVIDGKVHKITKIDQHDEGPQHTHRVHVACGMTIDVDLGGVKKHSRHMQRSQEHADPSWREKHKDHAQDALDSGESWEHERWTKHKSKATCDHCSAVEAGTVEAITHEKSHNPPTTVRADISTGLPCAVCGSELRIRANKTVACVSHGHAFDIPGVLSTSMGLLHRLDRMAQGKE